MTSATPVVAEQLVKEYREGFWRTKKRALDSISFSIAAGVIYCLIGPNGAGKTTILHLLMGFLRPTGGQIRVFGKLPTSKDSRQSVGFLPEFPAVDRPTTGRRFLARMDVLNGGDQAGRGNRIEGALEAMELSEAADRRIGTYSKGMTQRIGLAQAILGDPQLLVLDEPMSALDPRSRFLVKKFLRKRREGGLTTLLSTHILSDVEDLADQVLILRSGDVRFEGGLEELKGDARRAKIVFHARDVAPLKALLAELGVSCSPLLDSPGNYQVDVSGESHVDALLRELLRGGASIVSVTTAGPTLESLFLGMTDNGSSD